MDMMNLFFGEESLRTLILIVAIFSVAVWQNIKMEKYVNEKIDGVGKRIDGVVDGLDKRIDGLGERIDRLGKEIDEKFVNFHRLLKENDFAHVGRTIKAMTYTLEKNKILDPQDKEYIDSHLDEK